jgi:MFS superfamily sulfate permease-like transporter
MPEQPLHIEELPGSREGIRILRLAGPLTLANVFGFQSKVRADTSHALILDFTNVPLADSAGIGALVGAFPAKEWTQPRFSGRESAHPPGSRSHASGKLLSFLRNHHRSRAGGLKACAGVRSSLRDSSCFSHRSQRLNTNPNPLEKREAFSSAAFFPKKEKRPRRPPFFFRILVVA